MSTPRQTRIIVVDDDAKLRELLRRHLAEHGFEVLVAPDGQSLDRLMLRDQVDLIVLDLMLPAEDGLSILRRLRGAGDKTPIIMLTARSEDIDRIIGLELGADDYLGKPFNPRELLARIAAVLRRRAAISACKRRTDGTSGAARFRSSTQSDGPRESRRRHRQNPLAFRALRWRNAVWPTCPRGYGSKSPLTLYSSTFVLNHGEPPCLI